MVGEEFIILGEREIRSIEDWRIHAKPSPGDAEWSNGGAEFETAHAWLRSGRPSLPEEIHALLATREETCNFRPFYAIPGLLTRLDEFPGEDCAHQLVIVGEAGRRTLIGLEATVDDCFAVRTIASRLADAAAFDENFAEPLGRLVEAIFGSAALRDGNIVEPYASLSYELVSALAGTLIEARRRWAEQALLVIHEFRPASTESFGVAGMNTDPTAAQGEAFNSFVHALVGAPSHVRPNELLGPMNVPGSLSVPGQVLFFIGRASVDLF
ncbi:MAG: hypothetical protein H0W90_16200 [Actinobacteria bacterium]|nr:hypothetical protein [Actinomycetota bacterium]